MRISDWSSDVCSSDLNYRAVSGGASQFGGHVMGGMSLGGRGNLVVYGEYTERDPLLAAHRAFARRGVAPLPIGGNFTDVASGRTFSYDADRKSTRLNSSH